MKYEKLAQKAFDAVLKTMQENEINHSPGEWEKLTYKDCREHAINHLLEDLAGDKSEPHIEHALTRIAMMLAKD